MMAYYGDQGNENYGGKWEPRRSSGGGMSDAGLSVSLPAGGRADDRSEALRRREAPRGPGAPSLLYAAGWAGPRGGPDHCQ